MVFKYNVGDRVMIVNNYDENGMNKSPAFGWDSGMGDYVRDGKVYIIAYTDTDTFRRLPAYGLKTEDGSDHLGHYTWDERFLEYADVVNDPVEPTMNLASLFSGGSNGI